MASRIAVAVLVTGGVWMSGCGVDLAGKSVVIGPAPTVPPPDVQVTVASPAMANVATPTPPTAAPDRGPTQAELDGVGLRLEPVLQVPHPTSIVQRPNTMDAYVTSVAGEVVRVPVAGGSGTVVANVADQISTRGESGLLDLAFDLSGNLLYLSVVERNGDLVVWEVPMVADQPAVADRRDVIRVPSPTDVHHAGDIYIDTDGMLWFAVGEGGSNDRTTKRDQDLTDLHGKLLRLDPDPARRPTLRHPSRQSLRGPDRCSRRNTLVVRVAQPVAVLDSMSRPATSGSATSAGTTPRKIDFASGPNGGAGANFGWPFLEGTGRRIGGTAPGLVAPLLEWSHGDRCAVTGGFVYRGTSLPNLVGAYVYSDLCDGVVRAVVEQGGTVVAERAFEGVQAGYPVSFGVDAAGELYFCSFDLGTVFKLVPD